ncbi:MAG: MarR family transcriptional regulator [SAR86 cluster bacterium]|jgi:MarR family transcriptional regulator, transcriptional regulator for hemolysin|uniref:MarR family transcriptional regulator n=1 Tax=SAR86 cluster bacterium TaxID=2030880 RepID=A0A972W087_9GAMM|nr:MarR family transcriptional regulator [SAR86 cluster bacterium]|tara:strand:- start:464 stop:916 length:453 start_codon:yes stop_codon:yes gene_type:complete
MINAAEERRVAFITRLFLARNRYRFAMDDQFKPLGITDATWRTLFYLEQTGDGVLQKDLARVMGIESPGLVRLLDTLEAKDLLVRKPAVNDRRGKTVHLTPQATALLAELHLSAAQVRDQLLENISDTEIQTCITVLDKILDAADRGTQS